MNTNVQIPNNRFLNRSNWPTILLAATVIIGIPYLVRRFGLLQNSALRPQELLGRAGEMVSGVTDRLGVSIPGVSGAAETSDNASASASTSTSDNVTH